MAFYQQVDWALDISKARFAGGVSFESIPGGKILIDPATQARVRREALLASAWDRFDFGTSPYKLELSRFLQESLFDSLVLVARTASKYARYDIATLEALRNAGLAE